MKRIFYSLALLLSLHVVNSEAVWPKSACASEISNSSEYLGETASFLNAGQQLPEPLSAYFDNAINRLQAAKTQCPY